MKHRRTARWARVRIEALLSEDNPLSRAVWRDHEGAG